MINIKLQQNLFQAVLHPFDSFALYCTVDNKLFVHDILKSRTILTFDVSDVVSISSKDDQLIGLYFIDYSALRCIDILLNKMTHDLSSDYHIAAVYSKGIVLIHRMVQQNRFIPFVLNDQHVSASCSALSSDGIYVAVGKDVCFYDFLNEKFEVKFSTDVYHKYLIVMKQNGVETLISLGENILCFPKTSNSYRLTDDSSVIKGFNYDIHSSLIYVIIQSKRNMPTKSSICIDLSGDTINKHIISFDRNAIHVSPCYYPSQYKLLYVLFDLGSVSIYSTTGNKVIDLESIRKSFQRGSDRFNVNTINVHITNGSIALFSYTSNIYICDLNGFLPQFLDSDSPLKPFPEQCSIAKFFKNDKIHFALCREKREIIVIKNILEPGIDPFKEYTGIIDAAMNNDEIILLTEKGMFRFLGLSKISELIFGDNLKHPYKRLVCSKDYYALICANSLTKTPQSEQIVETKLYQFGDPLDSPKAELSGVINIVNYRNYIILIAYYIYSIFIIEDGKLKEVGRRHFPVRHMKMHDDLIFFLSDLGLYIDNLSTTYLVSPMIEYRDPKSRKSIPLCPLMSDTILEIKNKEGDDGKCLVTVSNVFGRVEQLEIDVSGVIMEKPYMNDLTPIMKVESVLASKYDSIVYKIMNRYKGKRFAYIYYSKSDEQRAITNRIFKEYIDNC